MLSWREDHLALILSLYNYKASHWVGQPKGEQLHVLESKLQVREEFMFDALLQQNNALAINQYAHHKSSPYLMPRTCAGRVSPTLCDNEASLAIVIQNLAAIDVVVTTEHLGTQLSLQLKWHAPSVELDTSRHDNERQRAKQVLSSAMREKVTESSIFQQEQFVSDFAKRVAHARTAYAAGCLEYRSRGQPCPLVCQVNVSAHEQRLLTCALPVESAAQCLPIAGER
jgi:hypothetical protein